MMDSQCSDRSKFGDFEPIGNRNTEHQIAVIWDECEPQGLQRSIVRPQCNQTVSPWKPRCGHDLPVSCDPLKSHPLARNLFRNRPRFFNVREKRALSGIMSPDGSHCFGALESCFRGGFGKQYGQIQSVFLRPTFPRYLNQQRAAHDSNPSRSQDVLVQPFVHSPVFRMLRRQPGAGEKRRVEGSWQ